MTVYRRIYRLLSAVAVIMALAMLILAEPGGAVQAQAPAGVLGSVVITVGGSGTDYGYSAASPGYGTLVSGQWPGGLFDDGNARTVSLVREDADADWYWGYSGGTADNWSTDQAALDLIEVTVTYDSRADTRHFILGGAINATTTTNGLRLNPPLPSRDWADRAGEDVEVEFRRRVGQPTAATPVTVGEPTTREGSFFRYVVDTTPGGPVMAQVLIVIAVYAGIIYKTKATPRALIFAAMVLVLSPWVPALFGFGEPVGASIVLINVALGAYAYRSLTANQP